MVFSSVALAAPITTAGVARSAHFEVYAQAGTSEARTILLNFERLRAYFLHQTGFHLDGHPPVRIVVFRSREEYEPYRLRPATDAYYVGAESRDTIVMAAPGDDGEIRVAAHEYAHFVLHANAVDLPPWLSEGIPEFFSAVQLAARAASHPELPARSRVLRTRAWIPLSLLLTLPADSPLREERGTVDLFYAESWALTDMLMASPAYKPGFPQLTALLSSGTASERALANVFGRNLDKISADLHAWVDQRRITPMALPALAPGDVQITVSAAPALTWPAVIADLLLATGKLDRALAAYQELSEQAPDNPDFPAALATISLQQQNTAAARRYWQNAISHNLSDPAACYRYAILADTAGLPPGEIRAALDRAVSLQPDFDNAHYILAHLESNAGRYESAITHLRAMHTVVAARQFTYWTSLAYAYTELGRRDEAKAAATRAREYAATPEEGVRAAQLFEIADTDLSVRFARDADGRSRLVTTRIPHTEQNWNPFIEPGDQIRRAEGMLRFIDCGGATPRLTIDTTTGPVTVTIVDPLRVQMKNAPPEFTCGPQPNNPAIVVYAVGENRNQADGIVRGIEFR